MTIITGELHPSWSTHQITIKLGNNKPLVVEVPWPFISGHQEIETLFIENKKQKSIQLTLKKNLNDPWPKEFVN